MTWGRSWGYIWDYYKPLMAAILAVILVISIGVSIYRNMQINHLLNVYFVNCNSTELDAQAITDDFARVHRRDRREGRDIARYINDTG